MAQFTDPSNLHSISLPVEYPSVKRLDAELCARLKGRTLQRSAARRHATDGSKMQVKFKSGSQFEHLRSFSDSSRRPPPKGTSSGLLLSFTDSSGVLKRSAPTRTSSAILRRKPLTRNGRSTTFPVGSNEVKSFAELEDMRNFTSSRTSPPRRTLSSHALQAFAKTISSKQRNQEAIVEQDPVFFSMIKYNPMDAQERAKYDDLAVKKYIKRHPEALKAKYDFQVGGRGRLTVSRYPLSALVALGASLSVVRFAIKVNPSALEASKDFHSTALHTACSFNTDMKVVRYIYNKCPSAITETTKLVYLPLHNACQASKEETPMLEVIQFLVEEYPEGLMEINKLGDTPLRMAQRNSSMPKEVLELLEEETEKVFALEENSERLKCVRERQSWGSKDLSTSFMEQFRLASLDDDETEKEQPDPALPLTA